MAGTPEKLEETVDGEPPPVDTPAEVDPRRGRRTDRAWLLVVAVTALPLVVAGARGLLTDWTPNSDQAIEALRMHEVGGRHTPLLGPYSRLGWSHPGPLLFWLGAPFLRLFGSAGLFALAATINLAGLVGALAAARRLGGDLLLLPVAAGTAVMMHTLGPARLIDPWNPLVTYLPLLCFLLCAAAAADGAGGRWTLPAAIISGSFVAQSHLGAAALVLAGTLGAVWWWWSGRPDDAPLPRPWPSLALTVALWSGPLLDQVARRHNVSDVIGYFLSGEGRRPALGEALDAAARELGPRPAWTGGPELDLLARVAPAPAWTLAVTAAVLVAAWTWAHRRGDRTAARLAAFAGWLAFASVVAMTRTTEGLLAYVLRWTWTASVVAVAAVVFAVGRGFAAHGGSTAAGWPRVATRAGTAVGLAVGLVIALATAATVGDAVDAELRPDPAHSRATHALSTEVRAELPRGRYALDWADPVLFAGIPQSVGIDLVRHGYDVTFPPSQVAEVGRHRTGTGRGLPLIMVLGGDRRGEWSPPPGARKLVSYDPVPERDRERMSVLQDRIQRAMEEGDGDADVARDYGEFQRLGRGASIPYDVWLVPATRPQN